MKRNDLIILNVYYFLLHLEITLYFFKKICIGILHIDRMVIQFYGYYSCKVHFLIHRSYG